MRQLAAGLFVLLTSAEARAVELVATSSYNKTASIGSSVSAWASGWSQPYVQPTGYTCTTGWNYVGTVNGTGAEASGVYLGYGWVLTAAHVGVGNFTLNGTVYSPVANTVQTFGTVDLIVFRIAAPPQLPALILSTADPKAYSSQTVMIGYGDGGAKTSETWGVNVVTQINESMSLDNSSWTSNDFITLTGASTDNGVAANNAYQLVSGDSGGAEFIFNSNTQKWELAGINEVVGTVTYEDGSTQSFSGFVQVDTYAAQIENIIVPPPANSPTMPQWALVFLGAALFGLSVPRSRPVEPRRTGGVA